MLLSLGGTIRRSDVRYSLFPKPTGVGAFRLAAPWCGPMEAKEVPLNIVSDEWGRHPRDVKDVDVQTGALHRLQG